MVIARILHGGMVAQQGLLHVGDIIKEVNGQPVGSDPRALQELLRSASGSVILKILPSYQEPHLPRQVGPSTKPHPQHKAQGVAEPLSDQGHRPPGGSTSSPISVLRASWGRSSHLQACTRCEHTCILALGLSTHAHVQGTRPHLKPGVPACTGEFLQCLQPPMCHVYARVLSVGWSRVSHTAASWLVDCGGFAALPTFSIGCLAFCQSLLLWGRGGCRGDRGILH